MKDYWDKEALRAHFRDRIEKFERYSNDRELLHRIFNGHGFSCADDGCDGFCPECRRMLKCKVYEEIKSEWEWIYQ